MKKIAIIGSGFSSLSAAAYLAKEGFQVDVFEKNETVGGRARQYQQQGFTYDMGPTWYWMPDVFERFFSDFGKRREDYYQLELLDPSYRIYYSENEYIDVKPDEEYLCSIFEKYQPGSAVFLRKFLKEAKENYNIAIKDLVYRPGLSPMELVNTKTMKRLHLFLKSIQKQVRSKIKHPYLFQLLEFPVLFLGAKPSNTPAFYNFMNYADLALGTWYPKGGMYAVVEAMKKLAEELGAEFHTDADVHKISTQNGNASGLIVNGNALSFDSILSGADYHHTELLLDEAKRGYSEKYWKNKTFAPSALLFYVGINRKLKGILHHMLFFDESFDKHAIDIYDTPQWPKKPLFYASFPSVTDESCAPEGYENGTFLIPIATGITDTNEIREEYFHKILHRFNRLTGHDISNDIILKKSYSVNDFIKDYNSYGGNAYGLANTLMQTAFLRPGIKSSKVKGLYFTGQLTVPGPGVPPALISGKLSSELVAKYLK